MQKYERFFFKLVLTLIAIVSVVFNGKTALAIDNTWGQGNLGSSDYGEIVNGDTEISGDYSFIAKWIEGKTSISTFGGTWVDRPYSYGGASGIRGFLPSDDNSKGKVGVVYHNVGMSNGEVVDLKITVTDWQKGATNYGYIWYTSGTIAHSQQSYRYVKQKWEFISASTGEPLKLSGYMTINDMDFNQGVTFDKDTVPNIGKMYVTENSNLSVKKESDGSVSVYDGLRVSSDPTDKWAQFTFLYNNTSYIEFDWNHKYLIPSVTIFEPNLGSTDGEFFGYTGKKLARTATVKPEKFIKVDSLEDLKTDTVLDSLIGTLTYELYHKVHDELPEFYYNSYELIDRIPEGLSIASSKIYDQEGTDVSSSFDITTSGNVFHSVAKSSVLKTDQFYNKDYRTEIVTKPASKEALDDLLESNVVTFKNKVDVVVNGKQKTSDEVITRLYRRQITTNHIDEKTKKLLNQTIEYKYDGDSYLYEPRNDLVDDKGDSYKSTVKRSGKVQGKDLVLEIPYHIPTLEINVERIQIDTSKAVANGNLPTSLKFSKNFEYEKELDNIVYEVRITDSDNKNVVYDEEFKLKDYQDNKDITLPTDYLSKDKKVNYVIDILLVENPDNNKFVTETKNLPTHAYTASEKVLTNNDLNINKINYSAVVRTVKERGNPTVKEFKESIAYDFNPTVKSKTGYGFSLSLYPTYKNEIGEKVNVEIYSYADNGLVDSYINEVYEAGESQTEIKLDQTRDDSKTEANTNIQTLTFEPPHMNVERKTGNLFTDGQTSENNSNIKYELVDGGRSFYIPIWADLGEYTIDTKSNTFGSNLISLNMSKKADVYAYMHATINNETSMEDELSLKPVYPDSSKPEGWTDEELNWLEH